MGGLAVVYEYANRLSARGHEISLVHWADPLPLADRLREAARRLGERVRGAGRIPWFDLDRRVRLATAPVYTLDGVGAGDALVATAWQTAAAVAEAPADRGRGFYLIQHHETWNSEPGEVDRSWQLPLRKIVIARWLEEVAAGLGEAERTSYVPNALDLSQWGVDVPPEDRAPRVGLLWHREAWKGTADAVAALEAVRAQAPELAAVAFGAAEQRPADLPEWIAFEAMPTGADLRRLYNSCTAFVQASWTEGWGLTATEAMACGCALVTADNGGSREYAEDGVTALVAPPKRPDLLAEAIARVLGDPALRARLARAGRERLSAFTWERSTDALERILAGA